MKNSKRRKETGYFKRLAGESLILSCLGGLSSKIIYFLKVSLLSFFFIGSERSDGLLNESGINENLKKWGYKKHVARPVKTTLAHIIENSFVATEYRRFVTRAIYTNVSTYGAFFITFGIYIGAVYCIKLYAFGAESVSIYNLINGCIVIVAAFPLLFTKKTLVDYIRKSAFLRSALDDCIPLDFYNGKSKGSATGSAIIIGSVFGVLSFFFEETSLLTLLAVIVAGMVVLYSPEAGLCATALLFPFLSRPHTIALICYTFGCYVIKVLRGKRNLHINTGSVFVLMLLICYGFVALKGGGENGWFAFAMAAVYLLGANLPVTKKLMKKCVQALCLGLGCAVLGYIFEVLVAAYNEVGFMSALINSSSSFASSGELLKYCILLLPFLLCKSEKAMPFSRGVCYGFALACMSFAVVTEQVFLAVATSVSVTLYLAVTRRQIFRPLCIGVGLPLIGLYFWGVPITVKAMGLYRVVSCWVATVKTVSPYPFLGIGTSEGSAALAGLGDSRSMYLQTLAQLGIFGFLILCLAIFFSVQRLYTALPPKDSVERRIAAATGASVIVGLIFASGYNLWDNTALCLILWLSLGLASAACHTRTREKGETEDEYGK